jgi:integrase
VSISGDRRPEPEAHGEVDLALRPATAGDEVSPGYHASRERARDYAAQAIAANTRRAYGADWRDFSAWCAQQHLPCLPATPETVAVYLAELAGYRKTSTVGRRLSAIAQAHKTLGLDSPTADPAVRAVMAGIRRRHGTRQQGKEAALTADVRAMVATLDRSLAGRRDRALLLLGFAGAFRRGELVALDVEDLRFTGEGLIVEVRRGKTDQEGAGRQAGIPAGRSAATCPVRALQEWLRVAGITSGPLFRPVDRHANLRPTRLTSQSVALVVKRSAAAAGLDPARYAGHSLRSGLATSAAAAGVAERVIMDQTGHKSLPIVRRYIRRGSLFRDNAAAQVGL